MGMAGAAYDRTGVYGSAANLIVVGSKDAANILTMADVLQAKIAGSSEVVMTGVGHHLNMEKPKEYNRIVLNFLMSDKL
jgi:pimeloyl-ACP methyl ester carboxylesterase